MNITAATKTKPAVPMTKTERLKHENDLLRLENRELGQLIDKLTGRTN